MQIESLDARTLSEADAAEIGVLLAAVWPKPGKDADYRAQQMLDLATDYDGSDAQAPRSFIIREAGVIIAHAAIIPRTIGTAVGDLTVAGLARVCTDPQQRGRGLGEKVAKAAFAPVDDGSFPFSLFQTSPQVQPFYERLGACEIRNPIVNSLSQDLHESPFWDRVAMRYPNRGAWPEGQIDLRGPGY